MFVKAIEEVSKFTRPIYTISRNYKETSVIPGAATLFFVNEEGCAITCKHVINLIGNRDVINKRYIEFKNEKVKIGKKNYNRRIKALEEKYNLKSNAIIQLKDLLVDCTKEPKMRYEWTSHPKYDLSILRIVDFKNPAYQSYAKFIKDSSELKQGKYLCRLGYPFAEFTNFKYNKQKDDIEWTNEGKNRTPRFPIEGMLTRHLVDNEVTIGIELSTPGLKGQSGGPLFNDEGYICGMQATTEHLHLGFDRKNQKLNVRGKEIKVNNQPFLHVGRCIHVDIIKEFLTKHKVKFYESE